MRVRFICASVSLIHEYRMAARAGRMGLRHPQDISNVPGRHARGHLLRQQPLLVRPSEKAFTINWKRHIRSRQRIHDPDRLLAVQILGLHSISGFGPMPIQPTRRCFEWVLRPTQP